VAAVVLGAYPVGSGSISRCGNWPHIGQHL